MGDKFNQDLDGYKKLAAPVFQAERDETSAILAKE